MNISAIVVGYNEAHHLKNSLPKLKFCDEILYFDLGSADDSVKIAKENNAKIILHKRVLGCEWIHAEYFKQTKHEWVLIIDPDEVLSEALVLQIDKIFSGEYSLNNKIGCISAPWNFHFKNYKLKGTVWGGERSRILIINNQRFDFEPYVHVGRKLKEGYDCLDIPFNGYNPIDHYWMTNFRSLFEKHNRYLKNEGEARYYAGHRTTISKIILEPLRAFRYSFFYKKGFQDGLTGLFLSLFWAWYQVSSLIELYKYQKQN